MRSLSRDDAPPGGRFLPPFAESSYFNKRKLKLAPFLLAPKWLLAEALRLGLCRKLKLELLTSGSCPPKY